MAIDTSIYNMLAQPRKTALDYQGEFEQRDLARQNALLSQESARQGIAMNALQMRGAQRAEQEDQAFRNYLTGGGDLSTPEGQRKAMAVSPKAAGAYMTQQAELLSKAASTQKAQADAKKTQYELHRKQVENGLMMAVNGSTPQAIEQSVSEGVRGGLWSEQEAQQILSDMPRDGNPQALMTWRLEQLQTALSAKDALEQYMKRDQMAAEDARAAEARKVQMRGQDISAQTAMRGQNMTDARARETNQMTREANATVYDAERGVLVNKATGLARPASTMDGKPVGAKDKPLTEGQAKAVAFAARMEAADKTIDELSKAGRTVSTPGSRTGFGVGDVVNVFNSPEGRQLDQAKRDFINAVLRRESGAVIGDQEFANAEKQYFPQVGDDVGTIAQKARNRRIALEGMKADVPSSYKDDLSRISGTSSSTVPTSSGQFGFDMSAIDAEIARRGGK